MNPKITELVERIRQIEHEIELEAKRRRTELQADFDERRVQFEREIIEQQRRFKTGLIHYIATSNWLTILTAPVVYAVLLPMLMLDIFVTLYQWICFPIYGMARVKRSEYFVYDRAHLAYLNLIEKINCAYCSYGNGLVAYAREVVGKTEQYWCPIKHARKTLQAHPYYAGFVDFGDAQGYKKELENLRKQLQNISPEKTGNTP
mgnify:FL=1|jgi:hypothetical protein